MSTAQRSDMVWARRTARPITDGLGRRLAVLFAVVLALALLLPARQPAADEAAPEPEAIMLKVGTTYEYVLGGTPGTGAEWSFLETESEGAALLEVEVLGYGEPTSDLIGGTSPYRFLITALEPGSARLVFVYKRSWETEVWRTQTLRVSIRAPR